jgi:AcrR family transcriptional regulator
MSQLSASDWIDAGLDVLAEQGIDAVRVEPICRRLGVTKGSFYHHFQDRNSLQTEMLKRWRFRATLDVIERLEHSVGSAVDKLRELLLMPHSGRTPGRGARVDFAIRQWSRNDPHVETVLAEVDQSRMAYIAGLLTEAGVPARDVQSRAAVIYAFMLGEAMVAPKQLVTRPMHLDTLLAIVLGSK